ncbi:Predicted metal-binding membrane protein [Arthrobacter cupressi]|uniref:Predicted metal-binding membrane protein n=1 Tax=Arthrobacter cupressi TaxID=1045773 RepID=A0A1G8ICV9_9MICC|nr:Predicted metal-binding membrane protein [Arthrobacter cupressi]
MNRKGIPGTGARTPHAPVFRFDPRAIDSRVAGLVALLLALAAASWVFSAVQMNGMDMGRWTDPGPLGFFLTTWVVMLAAMMFPSVAPMVVAYDRIQRHRRGSGRYAPRGSTALFVAGYLLAWTVFGLAAYGAYALLVAIVPGALTSEPGGRYVAAVVILAAAAYQFTPAKNIALMKCRTPMDFILRRVRYGFVGALRLGVEHGTWCVSCCWALMIALFALGVMNLGWMAVVGAFIALEKMLPWRRFANRAVAVALALIAIGVALVPGMAS